MSIDYVRRPRVAEPAPVVEAVEELPDAELTGEAVEEAERRPLMPPTQVVSVLALCAVPVLGYLGLSGWAWLAGGVALVLSRRFWGAVRFACAYQAMRVVRAVCVWTARRRGELHGPAGSVSDPDAPWRVWLERG